MILILQHGDDISVGRLGEIIRSRGLEMHTVEVHRGDPIPDHVDWEAVVSLGGTMGAYDVAEFPWLEDEKQFLREVVEADVPTLGICLGCQLLADALGGAAFLGERPEIGLPKFRSVVEGDPIADALRSPIPVIHQDTWTLPPGGTLLAETDRYPHAFRFGSAVGIQAHPEATAAMVGAWRARSDGGIYERAGVDAERFVQQVAAVEPETAGIADTLFSTWLDTFSVALVDR